MTAKDYKPTEFEKKWTQKWLTEKTYAAKTGDARPKSYLLIEFPYPSGERLHVGHARSYTCLDAVARLRRMKGMNVLFPFGWDAFGLPAENYAIKTGIQPSITTHTNIENAKQQAISWGLSFDWDREINTTDPDYYRWTQWIFVQLYKKGLAYKKEIPVNWCPSCKINLADEEVIEGKCERCGTAVERRTQSQWLLKITAYADRLLTDLETVNYRDDIKQQQINWIGKKTGAKVKFKIQNPKSKETNSKFQIDAEVFTTRIDTLFGVTFVVVAPEVAQEWLTLGWEPAKEVKLYIDAAVNTSEEERQKTEKEKTGVDTGLVAINPANGQAVPVYVADYVLKGVGTGVVMGVPAHDSRDHAFAKKHDLPILQVVASEEEFYDGEGVLQNSGKYDGVDSVVAREQMVADGLGEKMVHYHLRDWIFSRQHYWGEPIPMVYCDTDGWQPVPEDQLPVRLPEVEKYQPTDTGESPLAAMTEWVQTTCPVCRKPAKRETDTMPNWAGSSWYFLRYTDARYDKGIASAAALKYWLPVDWYNGGMEHTTLHLLYSRFWHKFLFDLGAVPTPEPYAKRTSHGVILGPDGRKMSKSKGNVINPAEVVDKYGADTLRLYEMFSGPFSQMVTWSWESLEGVYRFLKAVYGLARAAEEKTSSAEAISQVGYLAKKVENDIEQMKFNTAVAALMEFVNWWRDHKADVGHDAVRTFLLVLAPLAPFVTEELWHELGYGEASIHRADWPAVQEQSLLAKKATVAIQVNGKVRGVIEVESGRVEEQELVKLALEQENVQKFLQGRDYRVIVVPGKVVSFVLS